MYYFSFLFCALRKCPWKPGGRHVGLLSHSLKRMPAKTGHATMVLSNGSPGVELQCWDLWAWVCQGFERVWNALWSLALLLQLSLGMRFGPGGSSMEPCSSSSPQVAHVGTWDPGLATKWRSPGGPLHARKSSVPGACLCVTLHACWGALPGCELVTVDPPAEEHIWQKPLAPRAQLHVRLQMDVLNGARSFSLWNVRINRL